MSKPSFLMSRGAFLVSWIVMLGVLTVAARASAAHTPGYAIVKARIVSPGAATVESGTIVLRKGRIAALGSDVAAPPDCIVIDGSGWTLYPGFVDGHSNLGRPQGNQRQRPGRGAGGPPGSAAQRSQTAESGPQTRALTAFTSDAAVLRAAHGAGLTVAAIAPDGGIFQGQSAVIALREGPLSERTLRDGWSQHLAFERLRGRYPGTLMGALAHIRQRFEDADWYQRAWEHFRSYPAKGGRPEHDLDLEALGPAVRGQQAVVFEAWTENEILRALKLGAELNLLSLISGGVEAWRVAKHLKRADRTVVLSLDLRPKQEPAGFGGGAGGAVENPSPADQEDARSNAARLHESGVRFVFGSLDLEDLSRLLPNLRAAVEAGLPRDVALEALTIGPARLLGIDGSTGTLEVGKAANLVAINGDLFESDSQVAAVWVDGEYHAIERSRPQRQMTGRGPGPRGRRGPGARAAVSESEEEQIDSRELLSKRAPHGPLWPEADVTAVRNATILTANGATIAAGTVVIRGGKIEAIGPDGDIDIPSGASEIDATGMFVTPGIIDAHSHMSITGGGNESSESVTPEVRIADVVNHQDPTIFRALAGGVTTINVLHGSANVIGGQNAVLKLRWGKPAADLFVEGAPLGVKFALGENPKRSNRAPTPGADRRYPGTRMGVEYLLRKSFTDAREYQKLWKEYEASQARGENPPPLRRDLRMEALVDILDGRIKVHAHCYRSDEILMLLRVAEDFGFRIASLQHVLEGYKVADEIAAHGAGASTFADNWAYKMEAFDAIPYNMAIMAGRGVTVSVNSDSGERVRRLYVEGAKAIKYGGVSEEAALQMITLNPARHLGIADRVGSLEVGKDADLAIFKHHPFSGQARVEYTLVDGQVYFDRSKVEITDSVLMAAAAEIARNDNDGEQEEDPASASSEERDSRFVEWTPPATEPESAPGYGDLSAPSLGSGRLAITGATIHTMAGPPIENGTILIEDGKIRAVGRNVRVPGGTRRIQARGMVVTPGLINTGTSLGLSEIGSVAATQDVREIEDVNSTAKAAVAIHPHSEMLPITRANGVTTAVAEPVGGLIGGQSALIDLSGWTGPEVVARSPLAMQISFPEMGGGRRRFNQAGGGGADPREQVNRQRETLRQWMRRARAYAGGLSAGTLEPDQRTLELEALVPVVWGQLPVIVSAGSEEGIKAALAFLDEFQLKGILASTRDVWKVVDEIVESGVPVLLGPIESSPARLDPYDAIFVTARLLHERRVPFAFRTGGASNARNLPYHAALATAFGLPREAAWHALTLGAAEILGIADLYGSVEPGKIANLVVADGDLLDVPTEVKHVIIRGHEVDLDNRHSRLYRKFQGRPKP